MELKGPDLAHLERREAHDVSAEPWERRQNILLWRKWAPLFDFPAVYSSLPLYSMGGTDSQLLWHARNLVEMGHRVQVLGATARNMEEHGVEFLGSSCREDQERLVADGKVRQPSVVFLEGAFDAAPYFQAWFPNARIVHVGQNIDRLADRAAFGLEQYIDLYALVGLGQLADYCVRFPNLRHKFHLLRNVVPWSWLYKSSLRHTVVDSIAWVGSWGKQGLRSWAEVMERVLKEWPTYSWTLYGPSYGSAPESFPDHLFYGLDLPEERIFVKNVPMSQLVEELSSARVVLVSLGGECGPISALDAHLAGRPVLSGNDVVYRYSNPDATGIRVVTVDEAYQALVYLLRNPQLCDRLGTNGHQFVLSEFTEKEQRKDLRSILELLDATEPDEYPTFRAHARWREALGIFQERLRRKLRQFRAWSVRL